MGVWESYRNFVIQAFEPIELLERKISLGRECLSLNSLEEVASRCSVLVYKAEKDIIMLADGCLPTFLAHKNYLIEAIKQRCSDGSDTSIKILARTGKSADAFTHLLQGYEGKIDILEIPKDKIRNPAYRNDSFIISDRKDVFIGKTSPPEAYFVQNAELLAGMFESDINRLYKRQKAGQPVFKS